MALNDYAVRRDKFEPEEERHGLGLAFPCNVCRHSHHRDDEEPCRTCDHNSNAKPE